jgi:hypothetical protein
MATVEDFFKMNRKRAVPAMPFRPEKPVNKGGEVS